MGRRILAVAVLAAAFPSSAAAASHYFPKPGHGCGMGYVRKRITARTHKNGKVVTVQRIECVAKPRKATTSQILADLESTYSYPYTSYFDVSGTVYAGSSELRGLPITYTITDGTTNAAVGTFTGTSNLAATCTIVVTLNSDQTVRTYTGQPVTPYEACSLGSISMPATDEGLISVSFAGNSHYAPSSSSPAAFG